MFKVFSLFSLKLTPNKACRHFAQFAACCARSASKKAVIAAKAADQPQQQKSKKHLKALNLLNKIIDEVIETNKKRLSGNDQLGKIVQIKSKLILAKKSEDIDEKKTTKKPTKKTISPKKDQITSSKTLEAVNYPLLTEYEYKKLDFKFGL